MSTTNGRDERGLLPYPVIAAATKGDPAAVEVVALHYSSYIQYLSWDRGSHNQDIADRMRVKLIKAILDFCIRENE